MSLECGKKQEQPEETQADTHGEHANMLTETTLLGASNPSCCEATEAANRGRVLIK